MFEVKITFKESSQDSQYIVQRQITIARFEETEGRTLGRGYLTALAYARSKAVAFAKQIDSAYSVDVINVADEDNVDKAFGLVYHRDGEYV